GGLGRHGHEVCVVAEVEGSGEDHPFVRALRAQGAEGLDVHIVEAAGRRYRREVAAIGDVVSRAAPDLLHTDGYQPDGLYGSVARSAGIPRVTTLHGFTGGGLRNRLYEWLQVRAARTADAVVCVSTPMAQGMRERGVPLGRLH